MMRKIYFALFVLLSVYSCQKNDLPVDNGCISQIKRQNFNIKSSDSVAAVGWLKQNNLPYSNIQLEYVWADTTTTNGSITIHQSLSAIQYINGLPIISYDFGYLFKNNILQETTGKIYSSINLDTRSTQTLPRLRELYIAEVGKNAIANNATKLEDSCLVAQFGYYDLNATINNSTPNFVKAWGVTPKHAPYPQVFFRDDNGKTILYNGGFILD